MLAIRVAYGIGIRLHGMCEVTPYMEATTACRGISLIYHTLQCYITYTTWCNAFDLYHKCGYRTLYYATYSGFYSSVHTG